MEEPTYWNRFWRRQISRRRLITGAALGGSGLFAAAAVGCSSSTSNTSSSRTPADVNAAAIDPYDGRRQFVAPSGARSGGTLRYPGFDAVAIDRFDPHQTAFGTMFS